MLSPKITELGNLVVSAFRIHAPKLLKQGSKTGSKIRQVELSSAGSILLQIGTGAGEQTLLCGLFAFFLLFGPQVCIIE